MRAPTIDEARAAAQRLCDAAGVTLLPPDHPLRPVIVHAVAAASAIGGGGAWDSAHVRDRVSVTLPGAGLGLDAMRALPPLAGWPIGRLLAGIGEVAGLGRDAVVSIATETWADPVGLLATVQHELGHVGSIRAGGLPWCLLLLLSSEVRAAAEAPCYGASMAVLHRIGGWSTAAAAEGAMRSLAGYGLDADGLALAAEMIAQHRATLDAGEDLGGVVAEVVSALAAVRGEQ